MTFRLGFWPVNPVSFGDARCLASLTPTMTMRLAGQVRPFYVSLDWTLAYRAPFVGLVDNKRFAGYFRELFDQMSVCDIMKTYHTFPSTYE